MLRGLTFLSLLFTPLILAATFDTSIDVSTRDTSVDVSTTVTQPDDNTYCVSGVCLSINSSPQGPTDEPHGHNPTQPPTSPGTVVVHKAPTCDSCEAGVYVFYLQPACCPDGSVCDIERFLSSGELQLPSDCGSTGTAAITFDACKCEFYCNNTLGHGGNPTMPPTTYAPTTEAPTYEPTTETPTYEPTTETPTYEPTTETPTYEPTTETPTYEPTTETPTYEPTTETPTYEPTEAPTTEAPTTYAPTTYAPTTEAPTYAPTTEAPTTYAPTTYAPTTAAPTTYAPTTAAPTTYAPTTKAPTTKAPTTKAPTTKAPTTKAPTTVAPTTLPPSGGNPTQVPTSTPTCNRCNSTHIFFVVYPVCCTNQLVSSCNNTQIANAAKDLPDNCQQDSITWDGCSCSFYCNTTSSTVVVDPNQPKGGVPVIPVPQSEIQTTTVDIRFNITTRNNTHCIAGTSICITLNSASNQYHMFMFPLIMSTIMGVLSFL